MALQLRVASVNLQHWIKSGGIMIGGQKRSPADYASKMAWAQQLFSSLQPDIAGLQEIYDQESVDQIFTTPELKQKKYTCYLSGGAVQQVCLATTLPLQGQVETIQDLTPNPIQVQRAGIQLTVTSLSRPILKARLLHEGQVLTVFVVHLKSKLPSFGDDPSASYPEEDLLHADLARRGLGSLVSLVRRGAEAAALRREIVRELENTDNPVMALGDFNDSDLAVTTEIVTGDRTTAYIENIESYTKEQVAEIRRRLHRTVLTSAQEVVRKSSAVNGYYTAIHNGEPCTLDHILLSRHFFRMPVGIEDRKFSQQYYFNYYEVDNDHLVDKDTLFAPRKPASSDHGAAIVYLKKVSHAATTDADGPPPQSRADLEIR